MNRRMGPPKKKSKRQLPKTKLRKSSRSYTPMMHPALIVNSTMSRNWIFRLPLQNEQRPKGLAVPLQGTTLRDSTGTSAIITRDVAVGTGTSLTCMGPSQQTWSTFMSFMAVLILISKITTALESLPLSRLNLFLLSHNCCLSCLPRVPPCYHPYLENSWLSHHLHWLRTILKILNPTPMASANLGRLW